MARPATMKRTTRAKPPWLEPVSLGLRSARALTRGWSSYEAAAIEPRAARESLALLVDTMSDATPAPLVVPLSTGAIQLEWHVGGMDIEIVVPGSGSADVWYEDHERGAEDEFCVGRDRSALRSILSILASRTQPSPRMADQRLDDPSIGPGQ